jgi:hypothetical protein
MRQPLVLEVCVEYGRVKVTDSNYGSLWEAGNRGFVADSMDGRIVRVDCTAPGNQEVGAGEEVVTKCVPLGEDSNMGAHRAGVKGRVTVMVDVQEAQK